MNKLDKPENPSYHEIMNEWSFISIGRNDEH